MRVRAPSSRSPTARCGRRRTPRGAAGEESRTGTASEDRSDVSAAATARGGVVGTARRRRRAARARSIVFTAGPTHRPDESAATGRQEPCGV